MMRPGIPPLDHAHPDVLPNPYPVYRYYREHDPRHFVPARESGGPDRQVLTRAADVFSLMRHKDMVRRVRASLWDETQRSIPADQLEYVRMVREWVMFTDPPRHMVLRQAINRVLDMGSLHAFRDWVRPAVISLLDTIPHRGEVDLIGQIAAPITMRLVTRLLGVRDDENRSLLDEALKTVLSVASNDFQPESLAHAGKSISWMTGVVRRALARPADELTEARWLTRLMGEPNLTPHQIEAQAVFLLIAGRDNVRSLIGNAVISFLNSADTWTELRRAGISLTAAMREVLRFETPVQFMSRHAAEDIEFEGMIIRKGQGVTFGLAAANRDPADFENPDKFDPHREETKLASFGVGIHRCPGEMIATALAEEVLAQLLERWEQPRLPMAYERLPWIKSRTFRGVASLPVLLNP